GAFARRIDLAARLRSTHHRAAAFRSAAQRAIAAQIESGWSVLERELHDRFGARFSMDQRFPFHDRRLVEFALAIPESQRWRGGETKYVLRRASRDLLPPAIRDRRSKGDFSYLFAAAIDRECPESFR